jgi:hypothetical protein
MSKEGTAMNINDLTLGQIREMQSLLGAVKTEAISEFPYSIGDAILHRSVTFVHVGRIKTIGTWPVPWIQLEDGGWIAETARFSVTLATGDLSEFEKSEKPFVIFLGASVEIWAWSGELPKASK